MSTPNNPEKVNATYDPYAGKRWGDRISERRQLTLEEIISSWDSEIAHGDRKGPFDPTGLGDNETIRRRIDGADLFYLAARALIGQKYEVSPFMDPDIIDNVDIAMVILQNPKHGYLSLSALHVEMANLQGAQLKDAFLSNAHFDGTNLGRANLEGSILERTDLRESNLSSAQLQHTVLRGACLQGAHLEYAQMDHANLRSYSETW